MSTEKKRLEEKLIRLFMLYFEDCYGFHILHTKLLEKLDEFYAKASNDAKAVTPESFPAEGLPFPREFYAKLVKKGPYLIARFPKVVREGAFVRLVSAFEYFVTSSVKAVLEVHPDRVYERFRGNDNPVREQLKYLSENSLQKKLDFISGGLEIRLDVADFKGKKLREIIATRHIITHNRGIVDDNYLKYVGKNSPFRTGEIRPVEDQYLEDSARTLNSAVSYLSIALTEKYCGSVW